MTDMSPKVSNAVQNNVQIRKEMDATGSTSQKVLNFVDEEGNVSHLSSILNINEKDLAKITSGEDRWKMVTTALINFSKEIGQVKKQNAELSLSLGAAKGKIIRLEEDNERLTNKVIELELRGMKSNLIFYNLDETDQENCYTLIIDILIEIFKFKQKDIFTPQNAGGEIKIDVAHRIGKKGAKARPIVVGFSDRRGRDLALKQIRQSKVNTDIKVSEQYPSEIKEKRAAQIPCMLKYRQSYKDTNTRVSLIKDQLLVGNQIIEPDFEKNKLQSTPCTIPKPYDDITHTTIIQEKGSTFQGHAVKISTLKEACQSRDALFQSLSVTRSHHLIYAYSVQDESGLAITGNNDDGEIAASKILQSLIQEQGLTNVFLAVNRRHDGPNLGKQRFDIIKSVAISALSNLGKTQ